MNRLRLWWDKKAKEFVKKHVDIPVNMAMVESHHNRLSDMGQYQNRLNMRILDLKNGYSNLFDMIMGYDKDIGSGGIVHVDGLMQVIRKQDDKIKALEESLEQLNQLVRDMPNVNDMVSKNVFNDAINDVNRDLHLFKQQSRYTGIKENFDVAHKELNNDDII